MKKIAIVLGTRPEVLKNYSIVKALRRRNAPFCVLHTGQHNDPLMNSHIFQSFGYEPTEVFTKAYQVGAALDWVIDRLEVHKADLVLVNGDTTASLLGGLAALYTDRKLAHVEAGLRSYDRRMYEERHRIMVDTIANHLFTYTDTETQLLAQRRDLRGSIHKVGNTTVDLIEDFGPKLPKPAYRNYAFITLHRRELLNDPEKISVVLKALQTASAQFNLMFFPVHPHTLSRMRGYGIREDSYPGIRFIKPMLPLAALAHIKYSDLVITDSGVMQEEAYLFGIPCVTVRENTERPHTIQHGANILSGMGYNEILQAIDTSRWKGCRRYPPVYGRPGAGERIVEILLNDAKPIHFADTTTKQRCFFAKAIIN
jgi:UDP-N-acetylglucosamine 2-epimerase (non-hydrolysing)